MLHIIHMCHEHSSPSDPDSFHQEYKKHGRFLMKLLYSFSVYACFDHSFLLIHIFLVSGRGLVVDTSNFLMSKSELWRAIIIFLSELLSAVNMLFPLLTWDCLAICCFWFILFQLFNAVKTYLWKAYSSTCFSVHVSVCVSVYVSVCVSLASSTLSAPPNPDFSLHQIIFVHKFYLLSFMWYFFFPACFPKR